jgi:amidase
VVETFPERAASATGSGPLGGVPFLRKDILVQEAGGLTEFGSRLAAGLRMPNASELALRYQRAGLVILGRTTTPELAFNATTENVKDGPTRNPWDVSRSTGGSSGGSAAIVAAGAVPEAHGNDAGGSIRIPAACCGIVGLKPPRGRVPLGPDHGTVLLGLAAEHALTRTVRDSAAILDATQGAAPGDPCVIPPPARPFSEEIGAPAGRLKIAYTNKAWTGVTVDPEIAAAVDRTATLCSGLGHDVTEAAPVIDAEPFGPCHAEHLVWIHRVRRRGPCGCHVRQIFTYAPFTSLFNATGQPAISLPLEHDPDGLPVGMQFVARYGEEAMLFRLAASLEQAKPWKDRRPAIWAARFS